MGVYLKLLEPVDMHAGSSGQALLMRVPSLEASSSAYS